MKRPLPEDVARTARAYLVALVPADEVSDAWHELVADATYWGERDLLPVMALAHQVVLQHERITPAVAVLALRELDMGDPTTVARVLAVDRGTADRLTSEVAASLDAGSTGEAAGRFSGPARRPRTVDAAETEAEAQDSVEVVEAEEGAREPSDPPGAVRIGFEDDGPWLGLEDIDDESSGRPRAAVVATALVVALLVLWLWLAR